MEGKSAGEGAGSNAPILDAETLAERRREIVEVMHAMHRANPTPPLPHGVTGAEATALFAIVLAHRQGGEARPSNIARFACTTPSALSQTLKSLEAKGYIERRRAGVDSRGVTVSLTDRGRDLQEEGRRLREEYLDRMIENLGDRDSRELVRILRKVVAYNEAERDRRSSEGRQSASSRPGFRGLADPEAGGVRGQGGCPCA